MEFRKFKNEDADFCFKIRSAAFIKLFYKEIGADAVVSCVNAYMPDDYIKLSGELEFFTIFDDEIRIGFVTIKRIDKSTAELPLIYFDLDKIGKGVGRKTIEFVEKWIADNWPDVDRLWLDTIIPIYNGGFYLKMGFKPCGESHCTFNGIKINSKRFEKFI